MTTPLDGAYETLWARKLTDMDPPERQHIDRVRWTSELFPPDAAGPLLDLGCGSGAMLAEARRRGWESLGVDRCADLCERLRGYGYAATALEFDGVADLSAHVGHDYGVVTACDVIEHLLDPDAMLRAAYALLRRRGRLYVATPCCACWRRVKHLAEGAMFRTSGDPELRDGGHVAYYGPHDLKAAIRRAGFDEVRIHYRSNDPAPDASLVLGPWSEHTYMVAEAIR